MKKMYLWLAVAVAIASASSGALAATNFWLSEDALGTPITADVLVGSGDSKTLYCFIDSSDIGNTFEIMVGYDRSSATGYGPGVSGDAMDGKLSLASAQPDITASLPAGFNVIRSTAYADKAVVLNSSAREAANANIGGRPFGFVVREAQLVNAAPGQVQCFSFTLQNDMVVEGDSQWVVLSNLAGGDSFSDAWKFGTTLNEDADAIRIVTGAAGPKPEVGVSNKAILDALTTTAAPNYIWVFWGKVAVVDADNFTMDDGSGVIITVVAPSPGLSSGAYVSARGTLDVGTKTVTSQEITTYP